MAVSQCRQNYHAECEAGINRQINMELHASYCYQSMVSVTSATQNLLSWILICVQVALKRLDFLRRESGALVQVK